MNRSELLNPKLPLDYKSPKTVVAVAVFVLIVLLLPWVSFTVGQGQVTALNPNERIQTLTAPVTGFVDNWRVREGDTVKAGDVIAELMDNDPRFLERLKIERDANTQAYKSAVLSRETAQINLERQKKLFADGLSSRKDYELAKIKHAKLSMEASKAQAMLTKSETQLSRQASQRITAPRDGTIVRVLPGEKGQLIKSGTPIVIFAPKVTSGAVELWVEGQDASLILPGQKARIQLEGWPSLQVPGWPSIAIGTFPAKVHLVDQASSHAGKVRLLLVPDGPWPSQKLVRPGTHARGFVGIADTFVLKEIWRQLNGFPPVKEPVLDELSRILNSKKEKEDAKDSGASAADSYDYPHEQGK